MSIRDQFQVEDRVPGAQEYCDLRVACGLSAKDLVAAQQGLPRSLFCVTLREAGILVGMGRVVGDGLHVQVVDIAVHPRLQGKGLSRLIMERVMSYIRKSISETATVSLFADVDWLYQKFGFAKPEKSQGMFYRR